jgi:outer membrane protein
MTSLRLLLGLAAASLLPLRAHAADKPLWELGIGAAPVSMQDYRGSDQRHSYLLPLPYVVYRGDILQIDRQKVRGLLYKSERVEFDISLNGSVPVKSDKNTARQGMPDLDPTLEIGPQLDLLLSRAQARELTLKLPLRQVLAMDGVHPHREGVIFSPTLNLDLKPGKDWNLGLAGGPIYASKQYHDYFYTVAPQYVTPTRPAYEARAGYSGTQFLGTVSRRFAHYWVGAFVRADYLKGAVFEDSPLVKRDYALSAGFGIAWVLGESKTRVTADE